MKNSNKIHVTAQPTPNPDSMKFMLSQKVTEEYWETDNSAQAGRSPLAKKLWAFRGWIRFLLALTLSPSINKIGCNGKL